MDTKNRKFIFWIPRILSMIFIAFLALMSLDVISSGLSFQQILIGLLMHNIPVFILLTVLLISWKYEIVGGIIFILAGIFYIGVMVKNALTYQFQGYMLLYSLTIAGPAFIIGILFIKNWFKKHNQNIPPKN